MGETKITMKGKKTSIEVKAEILEKKINNPDASTRDIANAIWDIDNTTVNDILQANLPQLPTESVAVANLITRNDNLLSSADALLQKMIDAWENIRASDLVSVRESAFKQNQLLQGKPTDNIAVISDIHIS